MNKTIQLKKNLLDLKYNKYLQYYNTSIIILFTYILGIIIALITKQIDYNNFSQVIFGISVSILIIISNILFAINFKNKLNIIPKKIIAL